MSEKSIWDWLDLLHTVLLKGDLSESRFYIPIDCLEIIISH